MFGALRFLWNATRGHRFAPWRSEFLRWRVETYSGKPAETLKARDVFRVYVGIAMGVAEFSFLDRAVAAGGAAETVIGTGVDECFWWVMDLPLMR